MKNVSHLAKVPGGEFPETKSGQRDLTEAQTIEMSDQLEKAKALKLLP
jgi:hypothetical protein